MHRSFVLLFFCLKATPIFAPVHYPEPMRTFAIPIILLLFAASHAPAASPLFEGRSETAWKAIRGVATPDGAVTRNSNKSLRIEPSGSSPDAAVRSDGISLTIGKTYEISGWARTERVVIRDLGRSPIPSGATLTMESMPFDVHSASIAGTRDWTRLSLRFVATRSHDRILMTVGNGGAFQGKAWFEGVSLEEVSAADSWPARDAIRTFGTGYRYPVAGWIYLHIEGKPYDRGYQHGYLMAREIPEYLTRCAFYLAGKSDAQTWNSYRTTANALFLRGFDREMLEEMRGIADGANAAGARFLNRKLDLIDIVLANTSVEMSDLASALLMTPTGLEGANVHLPPYAGKHDHVTNHCSAFAATGSATRDGKMVIAHVTWWPQTLAEQTNVMIDIKPDSGHHMLMQSYPGGIESGTDWYQNDAGVVLTETTIRQTPFNIHGTPVAFRARRAAQYATNIDDVVKELGTRNNGLYSNEWLIGDAKNNEVAMYELGTNHTKLWRSSKNDWFNGTTGFYWSNNNAKDPAVKMEYLPDPNGAPEYVPFVPGARDLVWQDLYRRYRGQIDEQLAFKAFDSAPLIYSWTMDAKVATADMVNRMMVWAAFGRPNESVWAAARETGSPNRGLYPGGYYVIGAQPADSLVASVATNEKVRLNASKPHESKKRSSASYRERTDTLWHGWVLPTSDADTWFVAGSAAYYRLLQSPDLEKAIEAERIRFRGLRLAPDTPENRFQIEETSGVLYLDSLRRRMGDKAFLELMSGYFAANTTKTVTAQSFADAAQFPYSPADPGDGPAYLPADIDQRLASAVIVYGTVREAGVNRYAAEQLQARFRDGDQRDVPLYRDFDATQELLAHHDIIFIGRPETNSALAAYVAEIGLDYSAAVFRLNGKTYASERDSLVYAAKNPRDTGHMILVYAGNSPLQTARAIDAAPSGASDVALEDGAERPESNWRWPSN